MRATTTYAICLVPPALAYFFSWWWCLVWWTLFAAFSTFAYLKGKEKPVNRSTLDWIYKWFLLVHNVTFLMTYNGLPIYLIGFLDYIFGFSANAWWVDVGAYAFTYGVYFGLIGRDVGMYITETITLGPGFTPESKFLLSIRTINNARLITFLPSVSIWYICGLCSHPLNEQPTCNISCNHVFHERCLRGWYMVVKKTTCPNCPICRKKVDFQLPNRFPWPIVPDSHLQVYHSILHWAFVYSPIVVTMVTFTDMLLKKFL